VLYLQYNYVVIDFRLFETRELVKNTTTVTVLLPNSIHKELLIQLVLFHLPFTKNELLSKIDSTIIHSLHIQNRADNLSCGSSDIPRQITKEHTHHGLEDTLERIIIERCDED
jgi:hypothetical protein